MPATRNAPSKGGWGKKATQSQAEDAQAEDQQVEPTNNTAQAGEQIALAEAGTAQPSTSGTHPNHLMAQMLLMMQKTFNEQLKFQREQQKWQDSQLPPLEKIPEIYWAHNEVHSCYTIWKEQWNAIFKSDYLFESDAVNVYKLYRHTGDEDQKKIKQWKLNLDEITPEQLFEHLDEECKPGVSAYRSRLDLWHNTKQGYMTLDDFYNKIERLCDLYSFSPEEHKAFYRDAFLFNLRNQGTTQWVIEQLSKEDANPSSFNPQHIKNLAKTTKQNRTAGQYLSTNANTGTNTSVNLLCHQQTQVTQKKYQKPKGNQKHSQSSQPSKKSCPPWKDNKGKQNFKSKGDCTWYGDFNHKDNFRCSASRHKCKICSKVGHLPKMCFFKDKKQQNIQLVQAHGEEAVIPQMSDESFHDANEEYMPSDDDFVNNYMVCIHKTSLQQKPAKSSSKFQQIKHFVQVKLKPYHTHTVYMHAYVNTRADINLMPWDMYIKLYNDGNLKHLKPSDIKLGVWGDDQFALLGKWNIYLVHLDTNKTASPLHKGYVAIELEALAVSWALRNFIIISMVHTSPYRQIKNPWNQSLQDLSMRQLPDCRDCW